MSMNAFNGKCHFQGLPALELLNRFSKHFAQLISSVTPPHMQVFGSVGPKGACLRMREIVIVRRLFFLNQFLKSHRNLMIFTKYMAMKEI